MDDRPVNSIALVHEPVKQNIRSVYAGVTVRPDFPRLFWWFCTNSVEIAALAARFTTGGNCCARWAYWRMAERVGVEPTSPVLPGYPLSRRALSTTQTPLPRGSLAEAQFLSNPRSRLSSLRKKRLYR